MDEHIDRLTMRPEELLQHLSELMDAWHLELAILADAIGHVLQGIEEPEGLAATAYVLRTRLDQLVESCPMADSPDMATQARASRIRPAAEDIDLSDIDVGLSADLDGVPADLLTGGRDD